MMGTTQASFHMPLVSVIVPVYNVGAYVGACVESIVRQTYENIQVLIVNDGSTDNSGEICDKISATDPRITVIHQKNHGLVAARQVGLEHAMGEFVCNVDGDDWIQPTTIEAFVAEALKSGADVVVAGHEEELLGRRVCVSNRLPLGSYSRSEIREYVVPRMLNSGQFSEFGIFSYLWGKMFRRRLLLRYQMDVDRGIAVGEDAAVVYPALAAAGSISVIGSCGYVYRQRPCSMIKNSLLDESTRLQRLGDFLSRCFIGTEHWPVMRPQILAYLLSLHVVRVAPRAYSTSGADLLWMFPSIRNSRSVALFGAGTFGQQLHKRLSGSGFYSVPCWSDINWTLYATLGLPVESPDSLQRLENVPVAICFVDDSDSRVAVAGLLRLGMHAERLHQVKISPDSWESGLHKYGCSIPV